ncbi:MerR family transcriptional regulator [Kineococcus glutinatus]|uniref:TipAS antibiotic-recognition domain-containing protein n=1 Tax=Kineococcus glutinatus TaxID=1070872 RepID=A0ABP9HNJ2_9ACTN
MLWSIQELARSAGVTSRTLRHYDAVGLLEPARTGGNGYRYYDSGNLLRLQRILLLRELGLGLKTIAEVLDGPGRDGRDHQRGAAEALRTHLALLEQEQQRIARQIESVRTTIRKVEGGEPLVATEVFDGFDHAQYEEEVTERWGRDAWQRGQDWWGSLSEEEKRAFGQRQLDIAADFGRAKKAGLAPDSDEVQEITGRLRDWLAVTQPQVGAEYFTGLGEMYVADDRFRANYDVHAPQTAELIRDAMVVYAGRHLA